MDPETRSKQIPAIKAILRMQQIADEIENTNQDDEESLKKLTTEFYQIIIPFVETMNEFSSKGSDIQDKLASVLEIDGLQSMFNKTNE